MLKSLRIANLAIIDDITLDFSERFTVMTGETGAGKSILIDGLGLALGERGDRDLIRSGCEEARVEALFDIGSLPEACAILKEMEVPVSDGELVLKRVISASGKGRCSANGSPLPLAQLKRIGDLLVDLHGQHDHQLLLSEAHHARFLDAFGGLVDLREKVRETCREWRAREEELARLKERERDKAQRLDLLSFQENEINSARLKPGEDSELEHEKTRLAHARRIGEALAGARDSLQGEGGARESLGAAIAALKAIAEFDPAGAGTRLESLKRLLEEIQEESDSLRGEMEKLDADPARLDQVEERLDLVTRLKHKYGGSIEGALEHASAARREIDELNASQERAAELEAEVESRRRAFAAHSISLSAGRGGAAGDFSTRVMAEFQDLAMTEAKFRVSFSRRPDPAGPVEEEGTRYAASEEGLDLVEFLLAPNPGEGMRPLSAIASGGELSRIMLALKAVLAKVDRVGTLVFDEIDTGIGGRVAEVVGRKLEAIGAERQVVCITHLPQIAARADRHAVVRKRVRKASTSVSVETAEGDARIEELARMLAGEEITPTALKHARAMLSAK